MRHEREHQQAMLLRNPRRRPQAQILTLDRLSRRVPEREGRRLVAKGQLAKIAPRHPMHLRAGRGEESMPAGLVPKVSPGESRQRRQEEEYGIGLSVPV